MIVTMKKYLPILFVFTTITIKAQVIPAVDSLVNEEIKKKNIPGLSVAIVNDGKIVHLKGYGFSDLNSQTKVNVHTPFHVASISKTITSIAVFQLVEKSILHLDRDINEYLPFRIENPHLKEDNITIRELLNHRSGLRDNYEIYKPFWTIPNGDSRIELYDFLQDYLTKQGKLYDEKHYATKEGVNTFSYSNTGYAILGLIVEHVSGLSFDEYCKEYIFKPLYMTNTSWYMAGLDSTKVAKTYVKNDSTQNYEFKGYNGYPDYPAGQLRMSIDDFSKYISGYMNASDSTFIISPSTVAQITPNPVLGHNGFYTWYLTASDNRIYYSHDGRDLGVSTIVVIDVKRKNAIIIFANAEIQIHKLWREIGLMCFKSE